MIFIDICRTNSGASQIRLWALNPWFFYLETSFLLWYWLWYSRIHIHCLPLCVDRIWDMLLWFIILYTFFCSRFCSRSEESSSQIYRPCKGRHFKVHQKSNMLTAPLTSYWMILYRHIQILWRSWQLIPVQKRDLVGVFPRPASRTLRLVYSSRTEIGQFRMQAPLTAM